MLQVITDSDRRGAQVFAVDLGCYLERRGLQVETVALRPGTANTQLDVAPLAQDRGRIGSMRALRHRMQSAAVVIAHGSNTLMATALASQGVSAPIVYRQISDLNVWAGALQRRFRVRAYLRRMSHTVALWPGSAKVLAERFRVPEDRISIVPNGVRTDAFSPASTGERYAARRRFGIDPKAPVVLCVGALAAEKGLDLAITAISALPEVTLLIVGDGPDRVPLQRLADRLCSGRVIFAGVLDQVQRAYSAADVFLLPSRTESMPAVVIEAALCGLPVIATRVGAVPTMVENARTGFLVSEAAPEIAGRITEALALPSMGEAGRSRCVDTYSIERVGERWLKVLETVVGSAAWESTS